MGKNKYNYQTTMQLLLIVTAVIYLFSIPSDIPICLERITEGILCGLSFIIAWNFITYKKYFLTLFLLASMIIDATLIFIGNYGWATFNIVMAIGLFLSALFYNQILYGKK